MKNKVISISFVGFLVLLFGMNLLSKDKVISESERRKLTQFPKFTLNDGWNASFMKDFDQYVLDQFVFRDGFRHIKAVMNYDGWRMLENNHIYIQDDIIFKNEYPTNDASIDHFIHKINNISQNLTSSNQIYYAIIPDKNYYIEDEMFLKIDYDDLYQKVDENFDFQQIDLRDVLTLEDYYKTDTHWKQEHLIKVADKIGSRMGFSLHHDYQSNTVNDFYGVYYAQAALSRESEQIVYLTNDIIQNSRVYYYENEDESNVYTLDKINSLDKYSIFLDGASSFIEIENPSAQNEKELVIFRDSFASSLTPLMIEAYSKITLIDTRYINSDNYLKKIEFDDQDILFLYSTLVVNNSFSLKD